jgi:hypothetical protein
MTDLCDAWSQINTLKDDLKHMADIAEAMTAERDKLKAELEQMKQFTLPFTSFTP